MIERLTGEEIIKEAIKYSIILDDFALKSVSDHDRLIFRRAAELIRALAYKVKELENGEELDQGCHKASRGSP